MLNIDKEQFVKIVKQSDSMAQASMRLGLHFNTFKRYADLFEVYNPNQGLKGKNKKKKEGRGKYFLKDIIYNNKHPQYPTDKLRRRLVAEGIKKEVCEICNITEWNNMKVSFELNHKDGNRFNHYIDNLEIICPNCHSQTKNYRGKNSIKSRTS